MAQFVNARRALCAVKATAFVHLLVHCIAKCTVTLCVVHIHAHNMRHAHTLQTLCTQLHTRSTHRSQTACLPVRHFAPQGSSTTAKGASTDSSASPVHTMPCSRQGLFSISVFSLSWLFQMWTLSSFDKSSFIILLGWDGLVDTIWGIVDIPLWVFRQE